MTEQDLNTGLNLPVGFYFGGLRDGEDVWYVLLRKNQVANNTCNMIAFTKGKESYIFVYVRVCIQMHRERSGKVPNHEQ